MNYLQRKKLAFMSIVNRVKGFVRRVSGIPPLTLPDCVDEDSLIDYTITGVGVGDKNLFSLNIPRQQGFLGKTDGKVGLPNADFPYVWCFLFEIEPNTTYSYNATIGNNVTYSLLDKNKNYLGVFGGITPQVMTNITFTTTKDTAYVYICGSTSRLNKGECYLNKGSHYIVAPYEKCTIPVVCSDEKGNSTTTNIYLDKPLAEGETLNSPVKLPTFKGTTIYSIGTAVQPTNMSATYYSTSKE